MRIDYVRMRQRKMLLLCVLLATTRALQRPPAKVVVLDAYTATAGVFQDRDAAWRPALRAGDELVVYDRSAPSDVVERLSGADVAVVNKVLAKFTSADEVVTFVQDSPLFTSEEKVVIKTELTFTGTSSTLLAKGFTLGF